MPLEPGQKLSHYRLVEKIWAAPDFVDSFLSSVSHRRLEVDGA